MSKKTKIIFLAFTILVPFIFYCVIYYTPMISNAPFKAAEFVSVQYKWGIGKNLVNSYDSKTGAYQYLDSRDSLIRKTVHLRKNDILYLHSKANELGFWNFPEVIANPGTDPEKSGALKYFMQLNYKRKSKTVVFVTDYNGSPKLKDVAEQMQKLFFTTIDAAEERYSK